MQFEQLLFLCYKHIIKIIFLFALLHVQKKPSLSSISCLKRCKMASGSPEEKFRRHLDTLVARGTR